MSLSLRLAAVTLLTLTACVQAGNDTGVTPPPSTTCGAEALQSLVGDSAKVLETMRFGVVTRVIRPGIAVTMDYVPERLNIDIDAAEKISSVRCG